MRRAGTIGMLAAGMMAVSAGPVSAEPMVGVVRGALVTFDSANPNSFLSVSSINGMVGGASEEIVGIDFRANPVGIADPAAAEAAKQLYAVTVVDGGATDTLRTYSIDPGNGNATPVGTPLTVTGGDAYGVDFNHTVDRIRVVNDADENLRINPNNGARADSPSADTDLSPSRAVSAVAYDRVDADAATGTTLYGIASGTSELVTVGGVNATPSPNLGAVLSVGPTTLGALSTPVTTSFDISPSGTGFVSAQASSLTVPMLFTANLSTGALTAIGRTATALEGLAVVPASTVQYAAATATVGEAAGGVTVTVNRTGPVNRTTSVAYAASDGSAAGTLLFEPGQTSRTFSVPVANDALDGPDRAVALTLRAADAITAVGPSATLTITDDDAAPDRTAPTLSLTAPRSVTLAAFRRGVRVTATPSEAAQLEFTLEGTVKSARLSANNVALAKRTLRTGTGARSVTLKPSRRVVGTPRKSVKVRVRVVATDAAGNRRTASRTITVRRR